MRPLLAIALGVAVAAQPPSGPEPGTKLTPVKISAAGVELDAADALAQGPGALLFVGEISRNVAPMLRGLDEIGHELALVGFRWFTIRIADDRTEAERRVREVSAALHLGQPMTVSLDGGEGPGNYALNRKCALTLVLTKDGVVQRSVGLTDTGAHDVPKLREWLEQLTGPVPTDAASLQALVNAQLPDDPATLKAKIVELTLTLQGLRARLRDAEPRPRTGGRGQPQPAMPEAAEPVKPREGKPPQDGELRSLLRELVRRDNDAGQLDALFAKLDQRVAADTDLTSQARDMLQLMLSLKYGNDEAQRRARAWLDHTRR